MTKKYEDNWLDIVKRLNEMSNITPEEERQSLLEAAKQDPKILDEKEIYTGRHCQTGRHQRIHITCGFQTGRSID